MKRFSLSFFVTFASTLAGVFPVFAIGQDTSADSQLQDATLVTVAVAGVVTHDNGMPAGGMRVLTMSKDVNEVVTDEKGRFILHVPPGAFLPAIYVRSADNGLLGVAEPSATQRFVRVVVKPKASARCRVIDSDRRPVAQADVVLLSSYLPIAHEQTDAEGNCVVDYPADAHIESIFARKPAVGCDYYENFLSWPPDFQTQMQLPDEVTLTLDGHRTLTVSVVDTSGEPLANQRLVPWTIQRAGKLSYCNLSGFFFDPALTAVTDKDGQASLDWIPRDVAGGVTVLMNDSEYFSEHESFTFTPEQDRGSITVRAQKRAVVAGRVFLPDGTPAAGIALQAESDANNYFRGHVKTDPSGHFQFLIYPDQPTKIAVTDELWAAPSLPNLQLAEGTTRDDLEFHLTEGTLITGQVTLEGTGEPVSEGYATLIDVTDGGRVVRWAEPDDEGRYRFRVGPGTYELKLPPSMSGEMETVKVTRQKEIVRDRKVEKRLQDELIGQVSTAEGQPVDRCEILGRSQDAERHGFGAKTNAHGRFQVQRWTDHTLLVARDSRLGLAAWDELLPTQMTVHVTLQPAATITGTVRQKDGSPDGNIIINATILTDGMKEGIRLSQKTNTNGTFHFSAIPVGVTLRIQPHLPKAPAAIVVPVREATVTRIDDILVEH
ncbi:MAG: carboxypeptidase-like regulatory domain-containing protein [Pirellulaceae bacterium]|nr:hypothetical protein [Planctomycetales bacterium]